MRDELDRALDKNPDYPPGFDLRELEDFAAVEEADLETVTGDNTDWVSSRDGIKSRARRALPQ